MSLHLRHRKTVQPYSVHFGLLWWLPKSARLLPNPALSTVSFLSGGTFRERSRVQPWQELGIRQDCGHFNNETWGIFNSLNPSDVILGINLKKDLLLYIAIFTFKVCFLKEASVWVLHLFFLICLFILEILGFELRALHLPGRWSTTWATLPVLFCVGCFQDRVSRTICPGWLRTEILLNYRCEPPQLLGLAWEVQQED
jgi:hypothetical protein